MNFARLIKWKYGPSLLLAGANTLCNVIFQLEILLKLGVGARSDLYFASIVIPMVLYTLAFGALANVLIPMFVETRASGTKENTLLWNGLFLTLAGGVLLLILTYYPVLYFFPLMFRRLAWVDLGQVGKVLLAYSVYQTLFSALAVKNCFLLAQGRPVASQTSLFCGWLVSLLLLAPVHPAQDLWRIPLCLIGGNVVAIACPNLRRESFSYQRGFFRFHARSLGSRVLPVAVGGGVTRLEPIIDGVIASFFKEGSLTIFYFFARIMFYVSTITFAGYMQPEQKILADAATEERWDLLRCATRRVGLRAVVISLGFLAAVISAFALLVLSGFGPAKPYLRYFSGDIPVFFLLLGYLFGMVICIAYANSLYALRRERLFLFVTLAIFPAAIVFKLVGAYLFGLNGLAGGTSLFWISYAAVLVAVFLKDVNRQVIDVAIRAPELLLGRSVERE